MYAENIEPEHLRAQTLSFSQFLNVFIAATKQRLLKMPLKKIEFFFDTSGNWISVSDEMVSWPKDSEHLIGKINGEKIEYNKYLKNEVSALKDRINSISNPEDVLEISLESELKNNIININLRTSDKNGLDGLAILSIPDYGYFHSEKLYIEYNKDLGFSLALPYSGFELLGLDINISFYGATNDVLKSTSKKYFFNELNDNTILSSEKL